jgi:hypothetical protein
MCNALFCCDGLMKPHSSIRVVRRWHNMRIDPILRCLDDPEGLNNEYLPSGLDTHIYQLSNDLRPNTIVPS